MITYDDIDDKPDKPARFLLARKKEKKKKKDHAYVKS